MPEQNPEPVDPERAARIAWITKVRRLHRTKRLLGLAGIVLGAGMLLWWKYSVHAPDWALMGGVVLLGLSWALFLYVIYDRWRWVKNNPYKPGQPPVA